MSANTIAREAAVRAQPGAAPPDPKTSALTKYIPTETITLYVAAVANQKSLGEVWSWCTAQVVYCAFATATPIVVLLLYMSKITGAKPWFKPLEWPWWGLFAGTVAFAIWAWAVPGNPVMDTAKPAPAAIAAFLALVISSGLSLLGSALGKE